MMMHMHSGILRKSSGFGVFAKIFSKNTVIPSKEIPLFGEAPKRFWAIIAKFGFLRMTRITEFGDSVFSVSFARFIRKIGELRSKPNSVNPRPCQSIRLLIPLAQCWSFCEKNS
jgi:hypothetical protein